MKKFFMTVGIIIVVVAACALYLYLEKLTPRDFTRMPEGVLDDAIYAAQQKDTLEFKRLFTKEIRERMDEMSDTNTNRDLGATGDSEKEELFWTWDTLMGNMAKEGNFEVKSTVPKDFLDYMIDGKVKLDIVYHDNALNKDRQKNYTLYRNGGVWRIDLKSNPDFVKAYRQSVKELKPSRNYDD